MNQYLYLVQILTGDGKYRNRVVMTTLEEVKRFKHVAYMDEIKVIRYKKHKGNSPGGNRIYIIQVKSDTTDKFLIYTAMTTMKEVERFKKIAYMDDVKVIRYRRDKEVKVK